MKRTVPVSRRSLLVGIGSTGALLLAGCDRLSRAPAAREILASSERLTQLGQRAFLSEAVMAREYTAGEISKVFRANGSSDASAKATPSFSEPTNFSDAVLERNSVSIRTLGMAVLHNTRNPAC